MEPGAWTHPPRLPLGDPYSGVCKALSGAPHVPPEEQQREWCNCGYARRVCPRFPEHGADAVRFSVIGEADARLRVVYIFERDHAPDGHDVLVYVVARGEFEVPPPSPILARQATAFIESYLRRIA